MLASFAAFFILLSPLPPAFLRLFSLHTHTYLLPFERCHLGRAPNPPSIPQLMRFIAS
ncbi:hypothetical protein BC939DRAFT_462035 [Gamsiella multidivaricata]|uniref:uncharacterized protein n=1 Tax=Gamsiella multidivaricata TaxID=101098 RepID=UPI00221F40C4|nr:uncharacterized protein BC939DRAFT_462035 [Gamsiella multidivaricata]KAI7818798.1 hypothetical protein BC939DRAFT_462035 [Gamsiella multidivaricata]